MTGGSGPDPAERSDRTAADWPAVHAALPELSPLLRRVVGLDAATLVRLRGGGALAAVVRLPFGVLIGRGVPAPGVAADLDATFHAGELLEWLDPSSPPPRLDSAWRGGLPPRGGWRRVETIPDETVRGLVRRGALALKDAAIREGVPGAQPRAAATDALLDSVVISAQVDDDAGTPPVAVTLRVLSAVTRMGFLPRDSHVAIDVSGRWVRVAAEYGSGYLERPGLGLPVLR